MKNLKVVFITCAAIMSLPLSIFAQSGQIIEEPIGAEGTLTIPSVKKTTFTGTADASMFQMAIVEVGNNQRFSTLRYSLFFNTGFHINHLIGKNVQIFSGLGIKNLGIILREDTSVNKFRAYTIGAPLGLKIGNLRKEYFIIGGGVDFPFHYKEKHWTKGDRSTKTKGREWFSDKVNPMLAYGFLGYRFSNSITTKIFYYPTNFWSESYVPNNRSNIFMLTIGFDLQSSIKEGSVVFGQR